MTGKCFFLYRALRRVARKLNKNMNQRRAYDYPSAAPSVVRHPSPIVGDSMTGSMFDPCVVALPEGGYAMFVSRRIAGTVERWDSDDGIDWSCKGTALEPSPDSSEWDSTVNRAWVLSVNDEWQMWYTGQCGCKSSIGYATSKDGFVFKRHSSNPVIVPELGFEGDSVMNPCVLFEDGEYRMWYSAGEDYEPDVICEARSHDGINWDKTEKPVLMKGYEQYDSCKVGGCSVVSLSNNLLAMFYIGYQNLDVARICLAVSFDSGSTWKRSKYNPLIGPTRNRWDAHAVYKPSALINEDGSVALWFNARKDRCEYIGSAVIEADGWKNWIIQ